MATAKTGSDCKNFSLFFAGLLDSYRRNTEENFELCFRFASYDGSNKPEHVFVVINPNTNNEIWCDAVLSYFNEKKQPNYFKDKKIKNMALMALSGITNKPQINGVLDFVATGTKTANDLINPLNTVSSLIGLVSSLFAGHSDSYILDHAIIDNDWDKAMGVFFTWYQQVGFDNTKKPWSGTGTAQGVSKEVPQPYLSIPRFEWMPLVWQQTKNVELAKLINEAIKQGKLNSKFFINSKGEMAPESSILSNLFGGGTTPSATGGISMPLILGGASLAAFLIFKKK